MKNLYENGLPYSVKFRKKGRLVVERGKMFDEKRDEITLLLFDNRGYLTIPKKDIESAYIL